MQCVEGTRVGESEADLLSERGEHLALLATACAALVRLGYQAAGGLAADDDPLGEHRLLLRAVVALRGSVDRDHLSDRSRRGLVEFGPVADRGGRERARDQWIVKQERDRASAE